MASDNETVAEIVGEMRKDAIAADAWHETHGEMASAASVLMKHADRIEAAHRLEIAHKSDQNPKRNCDRFTDFSTAKHAWHEECFDYDESSGEWVNPKFPNLTFEEWLFAPVKEGGSK